MLLSLRKPCIFLLIILILSSLLLPGQLAFAGTTPIPVVLDGQSVTFTSPPKLIDGRVFLPLRDLVTTLGGEVDYNATTQNMKITKDTTKILFQVGSTSVMVNDKKVTLDIAPTTVESVTMIPLSMIKLTLNASVAWADGVVYINSDGSPIVIPEKQKVQLKKEKVLLNDKEVTVSYALLPKESDLKVELVIGQNAVGQVEELNSMAKRSYALAAINGGYFQSYDTSKTMDPYSILIKNGKLIHKGDTGSTIGFTSDGSIKMSMITACIEGSVNKKAFAVSNINHTPLKEGNAITIFTSDRGKSVGFTYGTNVTVQAGEVISVSQNNDTPIPTNGFVINLIGADPELNKQFIKGAKVDYSVTYTNASGDKVDWSNVITAIGAGPLLLKNSEVIANPSKEGFSDEKSFTLATNRSAVGVNKLGDIFLVAGVNCTLDQMASVMKQLGAIDAICMDGGTSSGLYALDKDIVSGSKAISNALIFKDNK